MTVSMYEVIKIVTEQVDLSRKGFYTILQKFYKVCVFQRLPDDIVKIADKIIDKISTGPFWMAYT